MRGALNVRKVAGHARPLLLLVTSGPSAGELSALFSTRGFDTRVLGGAQHAQAMLQRPGARAAVAILDFALTDAVATLHLVRAAEPRPAVVGIVDEDSATIVQDMLDAAFAPPVDPARLFVRVVALAARARGEARPNRIKGVVGVVRGNALFERAAHELGEVVPPVNAGPLLEQVIEELGTSAGTMSEADLAAAVASGRLAATLGTLVAPEAANEGAQRLGRLVAKRR
jgi:DNA-binding response OmpR family regulator